MAHTHCWVPVFTKLQLEKLLQELEEHGVYNPHGFTCKCNICGATSYENMSAETALFLASDEEDS